MRRLALTLSVTVLAAGAGVAATGSAATVAPRDQLIGFACHSTLNPVGRTVSVVSVMRPVTATRTLSVRFSLLQRTPGAPVTSITGVGDLGRWLTPADPTLGRRPGDVWKLAKSVSNVAAPATYRFAVQFRWLGAHRHVLAGAMRETGSCAERELRPDVLVRRVAVQPLAARPHHDRYVALIANRGATASGPFSALFTPGAGGAPQTHAVPSLGPGVSRRVTFVGPICDPASPPTVVADPDNRVDDFNRANNTLTVACPAA